MEILSQNMSLKGKLTHVCKGNAEPLLRGEFKITNPQQNFKPDGVWISWKNGWEKWCKSEQPGHYHKQTTLNNPHTKTLKEECATTKKTTKKSHNISKSIQNPNS